jgi:hypothetical protein
MPPVTHVSGEASLDGSRVILRFVVGDVHEMEVEFRRDDVQPLVSLLIALGGHALQRSGGAHPNNVPGRLRPFPVSAATIAEGEDGASVLVLEVGATALGFILEPAQMEWLGRTVLTLGAPNDAPAH